MKQQHSRHEVSQFPAYLLSYLCSLSHSAIDSLPGVGQVVQVHRSLPSHRNTEEWVTLPEHARQPQLHEALAPRLTAWERLFPASRHHERAKPSSCGGGTAGGRYLRYLPTAETRCSWRTGPGDFWSSAEAWRVAAVALLGGTPVSRAIPTARGPCPVPSPGQRPWLQPHVPSHSHSPGCSPIITSGACRPFPASRGCAAAVAEHSNRVFQVIFEELHDYWGAYVAEIMEWINESLVGLSFKLKKKKKKEFSLS